MNSIRNYEDFFSSLFWGNKIDSFFLGRFGMNYRNGSRMD